LAVDSGKRDLSVCHAIKDIIRMHKIASNVPHHLSEALKWHIYASGHLNLEWYHNEGDAFQDHIVALHK
jgi:hypothetical protein